MTPGEYLKIKIIITNNNKMLNENLNQNNNPTLV